MCTWFAAFEDNPVLRGLLTDAANALDAVADTRWDEVASLLGQAAGSF
jgi:hypothetical protein